MLERTESSVLVSLRELGQLEEERVARTVAAEREAAARAENTRLNAERAAREAEARREHELAEAARAAVVHERLEEAKRRAARDAAVEAARVAASAQAELTELRVRQEHEVRLAQVRRASSSKVRSIVQAGIAVAFLVGATAAWRFAANERAQQTATIVDLQRSNDARQNGIALAQQQLDAHAREVARLQALLNGPPRASLDSAPVAATLSTPVPPVVLHAHRTSTTLTNASTCSLRDPLCARIP
jgi:hypothetical protein